MTNLDIRWKQRFQNYNRAFLLLSEAFANGAQALSILEKEGALQRFEYSFELAWKLMKDYLEEEGFVIDPVTPRKVIKQAFAAKIISDGQVWINMLLSRNLMSHTYDFVKFEAIANDIEKNYLSAMKKLKIFFEEKL